jgi:N-acetylmuramoyl-L-alanine amidase
MGVKRKHVTAERCKIATGLVPMILYIAMVIAIASVAKAQDQPPSPFAGAHGTVAIDPGHGGKDVGSRGNGGTTEKEICLAVARELAHRLEPTYRVVLTRSDDYDMPLIERTAIANHHRADLFIGIHTGASYLRNTEGMSIYHYQPAARTAAAPSPPNTPLPLWQQAQMAHLNASQALAASLRQNLVQLAGRPAVRSIAAPLAVLQGADMPAVIIEVGYLTHPSTEEALRTAEYQAVLAQAIARGLERYYATSLRRER